MSGVGGHSGHLRNTIGVSDLFLDDPAWKNPNTAEKPEEISTEINDVIER